MSKADEKFRELGEKYGIYTREEFFREYDEMERMKVSLFVTEFGKESHEKKDLRTIISGYTYRGTRRKRGGDGQGQDGGSNGNYISDDYAGERDGPDNTDLSDDGELRIAGVF
jgi:hypothetical protein